MTFDAGEQHLRLVLRNSVDDIGDSIARRRDSQTYAAL
jgi:hypothetical protein